jgi:hypothetical protein
VHREWWACLPPELRRRVEAIQEALEARWPEVGC